MIRKYIREGQIVPMEVTVKLLENAMRAALSENRQGDGWQDGKGRFLIDGFPRKMDQALKFDEDVRIPPFLSLTCIPLCSDPPLARSVFPRRFCSSPRPKKKC